METGSHVTDGAHHASAHLVDVPTIDRVTDTSGRFTATLIQADGDRVPIDIEILHTAPAQVSSDCGQRQSCAACERSPRSG